jgi:hypothetical protein
VDAVIVSSVPMSRPVDAEVLIDGHRLPAKVTLGWDPAARAAIDELNREGDPEITRFLRDGEDDPKIARAKGGVPQGVIRMESTVDPSTGDVKVAFTYERSAAFVIPAVELSRLSAEDRKLFIEDAVRLAIANAPDGYIERGSAR